MGALWAGGSREQGLCELGRNGGESSRGVGALKFKCPAWQEGAGREQLPQPQPPPSLPSHPEFLTQPVARAADALCPQNRAGCF